MNKIIVEDRSVETAERELEREVLTASRLIAGFTIRVSGARPPVGLSALAYVLGMGAARTGAELDEVLEAVRRHFTGTRAAMAIEAGLDAAPQDAAGADGVRHTKVGTAEDAIQASVDEEADSSEEATPGAPRRGVN